MAEIKTTLERMLHDVRESFRQQHKDLEEREDEMIQKIIDSQVDSGILRAELN